MHGYEVVSKQLFEAEPFTRTTTQLRGRRFYSHDILKVEGFDVIKIIKCRLSKWACFVPRMKQATADEVVQLTFDNWIKYYSSP